MQEKASLVWALKAHKASQIAKLAVNALGRRLAYAVKARFMGEILKRHEDDFEVVYAEQHKSLGVLLVVRLAQRIWLHLPLSHLSPELQAKISPTNKVPIRKYEPKKRLT